MNKKLLPLTEVRPGVYRVGFMFAFIWEKPGAKPATKWQWFVRQGVSGQASSRLKAHNAVVAVHDSTTPWSSEESARVVMGVLVNELLELTKTARAKSVGYDKLLDELEKVLGACAP